MAGWYRTLFGRGMLRREVRALERLAATGLVPRVIEWVTRDAVAIEYIEGGNARKGYLRKRIGAERMPRVLAALGQAVSVLQAHGVIHLDLRQRKNILVLADDSVRLIDFESSWHLGDGLLGRRVLMPMLGWIDRSAALKWKSRLAPAAMTESDWRRVRMQRLTRLGWPFKRVAKALRRLLLGGKVRTARVTDVAGAPLLAQPAADEGRTP